MVRAAIRAGLTAALIVAFAAVGWLVAGDRLARAASPSPLHATALQGVVATDTTEASRAGAEILERGGNAVDAAVASALTLGVASPESSGLGGGGFLVYFSAKEGRAHVLDFRETAPHAATRDMFVEKGHAVAERSRSGGLAVAVPGEPAGLAEAGATYGKLGLAVVTQPAIRLARAGFAVTRHLHEASVELTKSARAPDASLRLLQLSSGHALEIGQRLARPELAQTLETFAKEGARGFYEGPVATAIVRSVRARGGILTQADLAGYRAIWREPLVGTFRAHRLYGAPPPAGGETAIEALQILDARPKQAAPGSSAADHLMAEALKHAFADRARSLGDPASVDVPTERLLSAVYARTLADRIKDDQVLAKDAYGTIDGLRPASAPRDHGTSHLCVVDGEGNVAALTTTVNLSFGAKFLAGTTGVVMNDEMDDFSAQPDVPNAFGLVGEAANAIAPDKRPLSSMTPLVVVKDGKPVLCAGGAGGPMIVSSVVESVVNMIDYDMDAEAAISAPRIHAQWIPDRVFYEKEIPADVIENLKRRGQPMAPMPAKAVVQAIRVTPSGLEAASDPRKGGSPAAP